MFANIAKFFIENSKLTLVLVIITLLSGIGSYFIIPKQYNPTIVVPAFSIFIPANGLSSDEVSRYIISPLENKIMELEGIDEVYGTAGDNYGAAMVKFNVGEDAEKAKIRLNQKLSENMGLKPIGAGNPVVTTIDPDILPQITFAINYIGEDLDLEQRYIYLKAIANTVRESFKTINNVTTIDIVGGFKNDIIIDLDLDLLESRNTDIMQVYDVLKKNNLNMPSGNINNVSGEKLLVEVESKVKSIEEIKKLVITKFGNNIVYLEDIAEVREGTKRINKFSNYNSNESVFLGVGKKAGTNAVFLTDSVLERLEDIKINLPKNISIDVIQNEGDTARDATNMLLINLAQSVIIVFFVLALYLGRKDAFNTAVSIPLTLGLVFLFALIMGENINRITLFALILVLGMLVDNSTVVVENISRHLKERIQTGKTKLEAVLEGVQEVGTGVILSTFSRLLAFGAMFAVGGMMGEYMGPIPKFAIMALLISLVIAFSINPWLSYLGAKDIEEKDRIIEDKKESKYDIRKYYLDFMKKFLNKENTSIRKRRIFRITFWVTLVIILVGPIYAGIFKARMLPKSNQDQIYLWIDAPRGWSIDKVANVKEDVISFFNQNNKNLPEELQVVKEISLTAGEAFMGDFANLFRGGLQRIGENQLSARINLLSNNEYEKIFSEERIISETYTIKIRPIFRDFILSKYPDIQVRLLEDPPGPPVRATFLAKIKTDASKENEMKFIEKIQNEVNKISKSQEIVDLGNSLSTTYKKINLKLDKESIFRSGLSSEQVAYSLAISLNGTSIDLVDNENSLEPGNLVLGVKSEQSNTIELLNRVSFTNPEGKKIFLNSIADIEYSFVGNEINTDKREVANYIFAEMGDNSLIYPVINLFGILMDDEFLNGEYEVVSWSPYKIEYIGNIDDKKYTLEWGGEWELTMDTFRDLGLAMGLSLLAIYFLLVGQFASFRIAGIIMITFLLSFYGVFPGFSFLFLVKNEYFSATSMIGIIALGGIVVGNAIILIDYLNVLKRNGLTIEDALLKAGYVRFAPIILTSLTTVFGAATIIGDPVWSGLAWAIIGGLLVSSILTLIVIPIFYYDSQRSEWEKCAGIEKNKC